MVIEMNHRLLLLAGSENIGSGFQGNGFALSHEFYFDEED